MNSDTEPVIVLEIRRNAKTKRVLIRELPGRVLDFTNENDQGLGEWVSFPSLEADRLIRLVSKQP